MPFRKDTAEAGLGTRRRGRITLGAGGVLYLVVSAMILAAAVYTQANLLFAAFGLVAGGLMVSGMWAVVTLRGVTVWRELPAYGVAGEAMTLRYVVHNRSRLPAFSVVVTEVPDPADAEALLDSQGRVVTGVEGWIVHLGPGQQATTEAPCWPTRRGFLKLQRVRVWSSFPFGVFRRWYELDVPGEVLVLPRMVRLDRHWLNTTHGYEGVGTRRQNRPSTTGEFFGLRAYRAGDPPRLIDWKRSAKGDRLVARELTQPSPPRVMVRLDLHEVVPLDLKNPDAQRARVAEDAITLAASLLNEAHRHGYSAGLNVVGAGPVLFAPRHGLTHRAAMLDALARLDLSHAATRQDAGLSVPSVVVTADVVDTTDDGRPIDTSVDAAGRRVRVLRASALAQYAAADRPDEVADFEAHGHEPMSAPGFDASGVSEPQPAEPAGVDA